ncbi:MAG: GntR family transcriptional regulator [Saprospiraceae bacterium]|nr:GntR family transcriptional regulator [Saprospiraceae bacterium]
MKLGTVNTLSASRQTLHGFYLKDDSGEEVLLPNAWVPESFAPGDEIDVFLYTDSEDRPIATTMTPKLFLGEFAWLKVRDVSSVGAFMDWGLPKDLFVPYAEQIQKLRKGDYHLVYLLLDERTQRLFGSTRVRRFLKPADARLNQNQEVEALLYERTDLGVRAIVNGLYGGLFFHSDVHQRIILGSTQRAFVKQVREDGKIDLVFRPVGYRAEIDPVSTLLLETLERNNGSLQLTDKSSPEEINQTLGISKKSFKRALGHLYKRRMVRLTPEGIHLVVEASEEE